MSDAQTPNLSREANRERLHDIVKGFDTAMLVTRTQSGEMHARPMRVMEITDDADACFATSLDSAKTTELLANPDVLLVFQGSNAYASIAGTARVERNRELIEKHWSDAWKVWFPKGKEDPDLCLVTVDAKAAEYWDNRGVQAVKYIFEAAKAYISGEKPKTDEMQNAKVRL